MLTKQNQQETETIVGKRARYIGREVGMRITGTIFCVDRYVWIRDEDGRERGCDHKNVRVLDA